MVQAEKYPGNPVLPHGPKGAPDAHRAQFYGSVIHVGSKFRMWYCAAANDDEVNSHSPSYRPAYAESDDGIHWIKPQLGLVDFNGNKRNNLLQFSPKPNFALTEPLYSPVLYEPSDPNPARRYKMALYGRFYDESDVDHKHLKSTIYPYFSSDGLRWRLALPTPKGETLNEKEEPLNVQRIFEIGGLYKFNGFYYAVGQEVYPDVWLPDGTQAGRVMVAHWSSDFIHWSKDRALSFMRYGYRSQKENLNEAHEPAGIWNRNNILIGTFGLWQGAKKTNERRMPLGFLISNDGIHFREPQPDFEILKSGADGEWDQRGLIHGQGYENVGDKTYMYYGTWDLSSSGDPEGSVGLSMFRRDGFGYLSVKRDGDAFLTTIPVNFPQGITRAAINADGLGTDARMRVELLDASGTALPGYSAELVQSGVNVNVPWAGGKPSTKPGSYRLRLYFEGSKKQEIRFYAAYLN